MAMFVNGNQIFSGNTLLAEVRSSGELVRFTSRRLPIGLLREAGASQSEIEAVRAADRRHEASRRARRNGVAASLVADFNNTRTFGIEIEAYHPSNPAIIRDVVEGINALGINCECQGYNHNDLVGMWKIVSDSSLRGAYTFELVSPILKGEDGFEQITKVCSVLNELGVRVNRSCGLHVHHNAADLTEAQINSAFASYRSNESLIDSIMPVSRRANDNCYCRSLRNISISSWKSDRYFKLNYRAYLRHNTIEFRQHSGTTNSDKIINWIKLTQLILINGKNQSYADLNEFLTAVNFDNVPYYLERAEDLAA